MSSQPGADPGAARGPTVDGATGLMLRLGFWVPLLVCTWLALTPSPPESVFRVSDVLLHGLAFTYLTFALGLAHGTLRLRAVVVWMLGYGLFLELAQSVAPERSAELKDLLVDVAGVAVGTVLLMGLGSWSRRLARRWVEIALALAGRGQRANS